MLKHANKMLLKVIILYLSMTLTKSTKSPKIVGGEIVDNPAQFPFLVSVRLDGRHICGGSIIDYRHVLTAAHCCFNSINKRLPPQIMSIAAGNLNITHPTLVKKVQTLIIIADYDPENIMHDLAIIRISGQFETWTNRIKPIPMADFTPKYGTCTVCGWGVTKFNTSKLSYQLRAVDVPIVHKQYCRHYYGNQITNEMICAGGEGKDSCQGDSGGPLICDNVLAGVVSWGSGCAIYPGVYTAVAKYKRWIKKFIDSSATTCGEFHRKLLLLIVVASSVVHGLYFLYI